MSLTWPLVALQAVASSARNSSEASVGVVTGQNVFAGLRAPPIPRVNRQRFEGNIAARATGVCEDFRAHREQQGGLEHTVLALGLTIVADDLGGITILQRSAQRLVRCATIEYTGIGQGGYAPRETLDMNHMSSSPTAYPSEYILPTQRVTHNQSKPIVTNAALNQVAASKTRTHVTISRRKVSTKNHALGINAVESTPRKSPLTAM